jgi:thiol-disulfide isomerase/thioredoxin
MEKEKEIITLFENREIFFDLLKINPGLIIIDFNAEWCRPCKNIQPIVDAFFASSPSNVLCASLNVDENFDLYSFLKNKKMVNGIPALLCYKKGNVSFIPDLSVTGSSPTDLDKFFKNCGTLQKFV